MKTAQSLNFKRVGSITVIWDRRIWLWNWNLSRVVITKIKKSQKQQRITKKKQKRMKKEWRRSRRLRCTSTISRFTTLMDYMGKSLAIPTTSRRTSLKTRKFCTMRDMTMKNFLKKLSKNLFLNVFSQGEWKDSVYSMHSCFMVNWVFLELWIAVSIHDF